MQMIQKWLGNGANMGNKNVLIRLTGITKNYRMGHNWFPALREINHEVNKGEFVAIMGPSGSGKSTMLNILGCLDGPSDGTYFLNGNDVSEFSENKRTEVRNKEIGFVFQNFNLLPRTTVLENVMLPMLYANIGKKEAKRTALEMLELVGLKGKEVNKSNELSGGEMQRVAIARALANNPSVLLADEPTGNLDSKRSIEIMDIFKRLNREKGITVILITHEPDIGAIAGRRIHMRDGIIERED
jgi:putative ABC transport system ATP-binding protein